ncbi:MAG: hypothetical protein E6K80_05080 [Candidatus Eisenbacteria bacterium]|uniref:Fibronectin type-III domain-containing protein n=1 Tax=Eiseniibacteriota bacterium TaxID=2212470 RepID=A0A538U6V5_UNCEI|nr:MAG: hypothetical protein E6K80_05080 [Candidatus Eisenbacteria bacterium]
MLGNLNGSGGPDLMVNLAAGLTAFSSAGDSLPAFPKPGGGGTFPTLLDLDQDGTTEVLAGSSQDKILFGYDAGTGSAAGAPQPWPTYRGDFQRTGCAIDRAPVPMLDLVAPSAISDLTATPVGATTIRLRWTAVGDDGAVGRAHAYDVRDSSIVIDAGNFAAATRAPAGLPAAPGTLDSVTIKGLQEGVTHFFAIEVLDEAGNRSPISNVVSAGLSVVSPAAVTDLRVTAVTDTSLTLAWTATGDDGHVGRPQRYVVRAATNPLTAANFDAAPIGRIRLATTDAGGTETLVLEPLTAATRYWIALEAYDAASNVSPLSNVAQAQTLVGGPLGSSGIALAPGKNPSRIPASLYWQSAPDAVGQRQRLRIYDLFGRRLRTFDLGAGVGGVVQWDGDDDDGRRVPAGLYLLRLESGSRHTESRLVLLP